MHEITHQLRFMLVALVPMGTSYDSILEDLEETRSLVQTYGGEVYAAAVQKSHIQGKSKFVGSGKAEKIADDVEREKIDIVVINTLAKPVQLYTLKKILQNSNKNIEVWDRMDLILHIFSLHAHTKEAKLQIDFANLRHMGPRAYGMGYVLSKQAGGIGTVGVGETNTELMRRHWRDEMKRVSSELAKLKGKRKMQIENRKNTGLITVSLVGYTNAGKTLLFNRLTKKGNYTSNTLFATLDSTVGKMNLKGLSKNITVSDTIGFIKNLPPELIDAFKSTLMESENSDLLLIVADVSDLQFIHKLEVVERILDELIPKDKKRIYVFNKIDNLISQNKKALSERFIKKSPLFISAKTGDGIDNLIKKIEETIGKTE